MEKYTFWNNKGGTGKTSLTFQTTCAYANKHPDKKILIIDLCPQANLSELFLGGQMNNGSINLQQLHDQTPRASIGGYFDSRLSSPFSPANIKPNEFITKPHSWNDRIPCNIDLISGDTLLELQANAMNTLANTNLPGVNTWLAIIDWINDLLSVLDHDYDVLFIDTNPSFAIYTQIALASTDRLLLPTMADDSSRRATQNAISLVYGILLPSAIYASYTFSTQMQRANRPLPQIHLIIKNRITQYMGEASAYKAVLDGIDQDLTNSISQFPSYFSFRSAQDGIVSVRDFGTTGVVAFALGSPFFNMPIGRVAIGSQEPYISSEYKGLAIQAVDNIVNLL